MMMRNSSNFLLIFIQIVHARKICIIKYTNFSLIPLKQTVIALNLIIEFQNKIHSHFDEFLTYSHYTENISNK